ncbi:anti-sigma F factor antagonist [Alicyclobacillus sp. TC]|uniref:Anti-sigma F factor antagonist n=1 Tax=Alicyclobacillus tolerans TaxID=90970 RepID=A0A1M6SAE4_9BACL|nr:MULTISPECIES: anti-sigma F factor antagonist [Alicyclobacillus]QRF24662.1 anti-sigma F factor antagonist [Alicyclobacillus sp. TC]SHK41646.1 anti-anti-sigma regulatory factor, SpoIIAA [Alicyclobacillus montanus]
MSLQTTTISGVLVARLQGELDHHAVEKIREDIEQTVQQEGINRLVLSFANIHFMDSSGIGLVLGRLRTIQALGGKMALCEVQNSLQKIFEMSGILKVLKLFPSEQEAIEYVRGE